jgi:hypothetical protein
MAKVRTKEEVAQMASAKKESQIQLDVFAKNANKDAPAGTETEQKTDDPGMVKVNFYLDADLHKLVADEAKGQRVKFSQHLRKVIMQGLGLMP